MTKQEFATLAMGLKTYYPQEKIIPNDKAMELWFRQLQDLEFKVAEVALYKWVATNRWAPKISEIREMAAEITRGEIPDWGEAWEQVLKAIGRYGSYDPEQAMNSLDDLTREAVRRVGFLNICRSEKVAVERANFREIYENLVERRKREAQIPETLLEKIKTLQIENKEESEGKRQ